MSWTRRSLTPLAVLAVLASCQQVDHEESYSVDPPVRRVVVRSDVGDVHVLGSPTQRVLVRQHVEGGRGALATRHAVEGEVLTIEVRCRGLLSQCRARTEVELPAGLDVVVEVGEGRVEADSLRGAVDLSVGQGETVGLRLAPRTLRVASARGDVDLALERPAEHLAVAVGQGDVRLMLPDAPAALSLSTAEGRLHGAPPPHDPASPHRVEVGVARGDLRLGGGPGLTGEG